MLGRLTGKLFDDRFTSVRLSLLALSGVGYLLLRVTPDDPLSGLDWAFAIVGLSLTPVAVRWPLTAVLAESTVFGLADIFGQAAPVVPQVGATWMLFELAIRAPGRHVAIGTAALIGAYVPSAVASFPGGLPRWLFGVTTCVGVPVLLGANIRAGRLLARQAEQRVAVESRAARTAERSEIARELHDLVAHHVASMVLRVGVARHVLSDTDERVRDVFDDLHASGTAALADLRRLVTVLRDPSTVRDGGAYLPIEPGALPTALRTVVDRASGTGLVIDATIDPDLTTLDSVRGLAVLRLTQEGLTNVAKHAGPAARARLSVRMVDGAVHWEITDDGGVRNDDGGARNDDGDTWNGQQPTDPAEPTADMVGAVVGAEPTGHGLTGMRERVEVLGGELTAGPDGTGWRLSTVLPAAAQR